MTTDTTTPRRAALTVMIVPNDKGNPPGKLADAEMHFEAGPLAGLKFIGFAVWERRAGSGRNVTFPARQYSINGERRSFALLRPIADSTAQDRIRDLVLRAFASYDGPGMHTRTTFDAQGEILEMAGGIELKTPTPQAAELCPVCQKHGCHDRRHQEQTAQAPTPEPEKPRQAISYGSISAADALQEASTSPNPDPAILMRAQPPITPTPQVPRPRRF